LGTAPDPLAAVYGSNSECSRCYTSKVYIHTNYTRNHRTLILLCVLVIIST
jgi:hypothetical protein